MVRPTCLSRLKASGRRICLVSKDRAGALSCPEGLARHVYVVAMARVVARRRTRLVLLSVDTLHLVAVVGVVARRRSRLVVFGVYMPHLVAVIGVAVRDGLVL
jgi:hypothetical protein